jgi:protein-disulfide isomerase
MSEVDEKAAGRLQRLRDEEYEARKEALDQIIADRLLDQEAARRGVTRDALIKAEVDEKAGAPTEVDVQQVYDRARARLGTVTLDQVRPQIIASLLEQRRAERDRAFRDQLRDKAGVTVRLQQPRTAVAVPADAPAMGPANATVTVVEFLDYQCPYCHRVQPLIDELMARYPGKLRFVSREFLLDKPRSMATARAARCANEQGRFWDYHRSLLTAPGDYTDADLRGRATAAGMDGARFDACVASGRYDEAIRASTRQAADLGVTGTPGFFINGRRLYGVRPLEHFTEIIDAELAGRS